MANLLEKASIILTPTAYSDGKMHSAKPIVSTNPSVGDFDFARASVGTRINEQGLLEEVASGLPRIDYTDGSGSWLLEPTATNLITQSEDFSNASWTKFGTPTIDITSIISPDGTLNGTKVTRGSNATPLRRSNLTTLGTEYTFSLYAKKGSVDTMTLDIGDETTPQFTLTDEWQRFEVTSIPNTSTHVDISFGASVIGDSFYIWGAQLEQNSYATSYIKTVGTAQTRVADTASGSGNSTVINSSEGVLYFEGSALTNTTSNDYITISDGTTTNFVGFSFYTGTNRIVIDYVSSGANVFSTQTLTDITLLTKIALSYNGTSFKVFINGVNVFSSAVNPFNSSLDSLNFSYPNLSNNFYGKVKSLQVYTTALSDAELTTLTTI
tara:strand:+ start:563 stop:1708 length:1146 start_codon:yes stop_codon:yes gene_type:complete